MRERCCVTACGCCEDAYNCTSSMHTSAVACEGTWGCAHARAGAAGDMRCARWQRRQHGTRRPCGGPQGMRNGGRQWPHDGMGRTREEEEPIAVCRLERRAWPCDSSRSASVLELTRWRERCCMRKNEGNRKRRGAALRPQPGTLRHRAQHTRHHQNSVRSTAVDAEA